MNPPLPEKPSKTTTTGEDVSKTSTLAIAIPNVETAAEEEEKRKKSQQSQPQPQPSVGAQLKNYWKHSGPMGKTGIVMNVAFVVGLTAMVALTLAGIPAFTYGAIALSGFGAMRIGVALLESSERDMQKKEGEEQVQNRQQKAMEHQVESRINQRLGPERPKDDPLAPLSTLTAAVKHGQENDRSYMQALLQKTQKELKEQSTMIEGLFKANPTLQRPESHVARENERREVRENGGGAILSSPSK